jgi:hypothetical protein
MCNDSESLHTLSFVILIMRYLGRREAVVLSLPFSLALTPERANRDACEGIIIYLKNNVLFLRRL